MHIYRYIMGQESSELSELQKCMMFDIVYEGKSDKEVSDKYGVSERELSSIKSTEAWQSQERKIWNEMISLLIQKRNAKAMNS